MANEKDKNKNNYKPLKNPELIGGRESRSPKEIVEDGKQGRKDNEKFHEMIKRQEAQAAKEPKIQTRVEARIKELEKNKGQVKENKKQHKKNEPDKDR